ncbi:MAG: oligosaccharide flippase family protein [Spirochaetes bacterium]|nr:oligosaccharide flippase family protein [Spirochaetota bacterium]
MIYQFRAKFKKSLYDLTNLLYQIRGVITFTPFDRETPEGRSLERYRLIIMSAVTNFGAKAVTSILSLVTVPLTFNYMGVEIYGLWMIVSSLVVWLQLSDLGIGNGLLNALTEAYGRNDIEAANNYITTSVMSLTILSIAAIYPTYLLSFYMPWDLVLNIHDPGYIEIVKKCFFIVGIFFLISMPLTVVTKIFIAYQLGFIPNIFQIIVSIVSLILLIICIFLKLNILWFAALMSLAPLIGSIFLWIIFFRKMDWYSFNFNFFEGFKRLANSSLPLFILQIFALMINNLTNIIISNKANLTLVSEFNIVYKVYLFIFFIGTAISIPFYPAIRESLVSGDVKWANKSIKRVLFFRVTIVFCSSLPFLFIGDRLISLWVGHNLVYPLDCLGWLLFVLCLMIVAFASTLGEILLFNDILWPQIIISSLTAVILVYSLVKTIPEYGMKAVYFSFIISNLHTIIWGYYRIKRLCNH